MNLRPYLPTSPVEWVCCVLCFACIPAMGWIITHRNEFMSLVFRALELVGF